MRKIKIALIDSGVDMNHACLSSRNITGIRIIEEHGDISYKNFIFDSNGHGTALAGIIYDKCSHVDLLSIAILDNNLKCKFKVLKEAIHFAIDSNVHIINLSLGTVVDRHREELHNLCKEAVNKGIHIVAAFNNNTSTSYPAEFMDVFGVRNEYIIEKQGFIFDSNSLNVYTNGFKQKVYSKNDTTLYLSGNSLASAHFSGILASIMFTEERKDREFLINYLTEHSMRLSTVKKNRKESLGKILDIQKGLLFPVNEENINRIRLHQNGDPDIVGLLDYRYFQFDHYCVETQEGIKNIKLFRNIEEGLKDADALLIGDISFIPPKERHDLVVNLITSAIMLGRNVFTKELLHTDDYKDLYDLSVKQGTFIKSKYL
ncbi:S8 family serine peptidase [Paenibacillus pseudetheri]|uniref:Peptidase S8/S53 domain-containing protein n=1 Tax=Paenibacillus pseudetheri TaxID=2897682 RepID=A0ABN8FM16_9BACL|nr:S8 family serine peptidase [Paenibacillus pseudetheri]CAH1059046.1 hypothetical protein PAECIP111894_05232 [Paenibacillus pseudetheri]